MGIEYEELFQQLSQVSDALQTKISEHSNLMKEAESIAWEKSAVDRADAALAEARALNDELSRLTRVAEEQLIAEGYTFPEDAIPSGDEEPRWWKKDLMSAAVPITDDIDNALDAGLDALMRRLPSSWWKEQIKIRESFGNGHLRESVQLYGGVPGQLVPAPLHRYAYALMLSEDSHSKQNEYDIYEGARLVPFIAAWSRSLDALAEVKGGIEKLDQLVKAPNAEIDSRLYELAVAARCSQMGRAVEFIDPRGSHTSPDLRIHDLGFPAVVECKMQSRLSEHERNEFLIISDIFSFMVSERKTTGLLGSMSVISRLPLREVGCEELLKVALQCTRGLNPYQTFEQNWGSVFFEPIAPSIDLPAMTRIYSPDFLEWVFDWRCEDIKYDGICALVANNGAIMVGRAELPFCLKWRSD